MSELPHSHEVAGREWLGRGHHRAHLHPLLSHPEGIQVLVPGARERYLNKALKVGDSPGYPRGRSPHPGRRRGRAVPEASRILGRGGAPRRPLGGARGKGPGSAFQPRNAALPTPDSGPLPTPDSGPPTVLRPPEHQEYTLCCFQPPAGWHFVSAATGRHSVGGLGSGAGTAGSELPAPSVCATVAPAPGPQEGRLLPGGSVCTGVSLSSIVPSKS